jgi:hypothetical protein
MVATQDDAAALATVTAVRTSVGVVLDMLEVHGASAALSRAAQDLHIVNKIALHITLVLLV